MLFCCVVGVSAIDRWVCDDVLDVVEGIAGETVIELTREEKGIKEICDSEKNEYVRKNQKDVTHWVIRCAQSIAGETTMKMTHDEVGIRRRYVHHKEMCI